MKGDWPVGQSRSSSSSSSCLCAASGTQLRSFALVLPTVSMSASGISTTRRKSIIICTLTTEVETLAGAEKCSPSKTEVGLRSIHLVDLVTLAEVEKCSPLKKEVGLRGIHLVDLVTLVRL